MRNPSVSTFHRSMCLLLLASSIAGAQAIRQDAGFRVNSVPRIDDASTGSAVPFGFQINFLGQQYTAAWVNNNGNITFQGPLDTYTPFGLQATQTVIIAPFFADVDTSGSASQPVTYGTSTVEGRAAFGVNWVDVGYFSARTDKLNRFQLVLINRGDTGAGNFDIEFNYERILWETGDASGGTGGLGGNSAAVGYSNGTANGSFELPGSRSPGSFLDNGPLSLVRNSRNSIVPGRYVFAIRGGQPTVVVTTDPPGLNINVDGVPAVSPQTYAWTVGTTHTIATSSPQTSGAARYTFQNWSDGGAISHQVTATGPTTFTARFQAQYLLTRNAAPSTAGTIVANPASADNFYNAGASVQLNAVPSTGFRFTAFSGDVTGAQNPQHVIMSAPRNVTANFGCSYELVPSGAAIGRSGGPVSVNVVTGAGCLWTATVPAGGFLSITSASSGAGPGLVTFNAPANTTGAPRSVTATIAGIPLSVSQYGAGCLFGISPGSAAVLPAGGGGTVNVGASSGDCGWTATSDASWLNVVSSPSGVGAGQVTYSAAPNTGSTSRAGHLTIAGQTFPVVQRASATACTASMEQTSQAFGPAGGTGSIIFETPPNCQWGAGTNGNFLNVTGNASGTGSAVIGFQVAPNTSTATRIGSIFVAGVEFTVSQTGISAGLSCQVNNGTPPNVRVAPVVRAEGRTEPLRDLVLECGGPAPAAGLLGDVVVTLNTNVTSRILDTANDTTEALLLVNEPAAVLLGVNAFRGRLEGYNRIRFPRVPIAPTGGNAAQILRIVNLRAEASRLPLASSLAPRPINATLNIQSIVPVPVLNPVQVGAYAAPGVLLRRDAPSAGPNPATQLVLPLLFQEGSPAAFRTRTALGQDPSGVGVAYNSESGFLNSVILGAATGFATTSTRLQLLFSNVPAGAVIYAPIHPAEGARAVLFSANANGEGGSPVSGQAYAGGLYQQLAVVGGRAAATYEVTITDPNSIELLTIPVLIEGAAAPALTSMTVEGRLAAVNTTTVASATAVIPRFRESTTSGPLTNLRVLTVSNDFQEPTQPASQRSPVTRFATAGSNVTFTHTIANDTEVAAPGVVAVNNLPVGLTLVSCAVSGGGSCGAAGQDVRAQFPSLGPGQSSTLTVTAQVSPAFPAGGVIENTISVRGDVPDFDPNSNTASASIKVSANCNYTLSKANASVSASGDLGRLDIATGPGCPWTAASNVDWITLNPATTVEGPGTLRYTVAPNVGAARSGQVIIAGSVFVVNQSAAGCNITPSTASTSVAPAGGLVTVNVTAGTGCQWTSSVYPGFATLTGAGTGTGNGSFSLNVQANNSTLPRTFVVVVSGQVLQFVQQRSNTPPPVASFNDVPLTHPYSDHITLLKQNAVTSGCTLTNYCPDAPTTRGQMSVFIIRSVLGGDNFNYPGTPFFTDVPVAHPYFKYIQKMRELGITAGCTATAYCPDENVTRGQMAVFLIRGRLGLASGQPFPFPPGAFFGDVPSTHPYFTFVQKMRELTITTGCTAGAYCPDDVTNRGQMAVFLIRAFFTP